MRTWHGIFAAWLLAAFVAGSAFAQESGFGAVSARDAHGAEFDLAALDSEIDYAIGGLVAEARIRQRFVNRSDGWIDATYLLPLPEGAAVHDMELRVGGRTIVGEIREKEQARAEFVEAAASGRRASLVETSRAQLFRTAVANIGPGEAIEVELRWWQPIAYRDGRFSLALPLTYTPRFEPGAPNADAGAGHASTDDVHAVAAPTVRVNVALDAGVALAGIDSPTHALKTSGSGSRRQIEFADGAVPADRDFVLEWTPLLGAMPTSSVLVEPWNGEAYAMAMLLPPTQLPNPLPRELILVIDTSGSMEGGSIEQAKAALDLALQSLRPSDRFNVIQFNSVVEPLFDAAVAATPGDVRLAREWVARLQATGGTEMGLALQRALAAQAHPGYVRQVVFATDGAVDDANGLYDALERGLGDSRLFAVGIGSAPNAHFIERAARLGRGSSVVVRRLEEVGERMRELFAKLDRPALRDLALAWPAAAESYPQQLPDLYAGEPLLVVARLGAAHGELKASGASVDAPWSASLSLDRATPASGIARLWAQRKADELQRRLERGEDVEAMRAAIVQLALEHHIVTPYTSLIAVERTPSAPADAEVKSVRIANGMPEGSLGFAATATPAPLEILSGLVLLALAGACATVARRPRRLGELA
ncbi:marine proteobacterial sortase target protein [Dokdonella sp.]|uniref:marine proteobacterial sortase target protein n=1 Tax=Dokdonella sp. TaxID=2291710 RepID=UPI001B12C3AE|nr:marine proteobacterial sortase target protein [Dokdonella sp.]MBO9664402.1 marine proteobacterial sortase target protein [Dokdonella sp.]